MANDIVNAINNGIASSKANLPVHFKVNDLANAIDNNRVNWIITVQPMAKSTVYFMPWVMPKLMLSSMPYYAIINMTATSKLAIILAFKALWEMKFEQNPTIWEKGSIIMYIEYFMSF